MTNPPRVRPRIHVSGPKKRKMVIATTGYAGMRGTKMRIMTHQQAKKWVDRRAMEIVMRPNAPRQRNPMNLELADPELDILIPDILPQDDGEAIYMALPQNRSAAQTRRSEAENWVETEKILTESIYHDNRRPPCQCTRERFRKRVRFISLDSYVIKEVAYCQCAAACSGLIAEGFFPSAPRRPGTVFSLRLLRTLHAQSALGSVSKLAWSSGLHMVFEEDLKTALPRFDEEVCFKYEHQFYPTLLTAVASGYLPPLGRSAICSGNKIKQRLGIC
jgi:hypothetical protein